MFRSHFAFAAIVGLLCAWSSISAIPASAARAEITYWFWKDNPDDNTIANLAAKFEKETGIHVNLMSDVTYDEFFRFLVNSIAAGTAPCAAELTSTYIGPLINAGVLEPLNDRIAAWPERGHSGALVIRRRARRQDPVRHAEQVLDVLLILPQGHLQGGRRSGAEDPAGVRRRREGFGRLGAWQAIRI